MKKILSDANLILSVLNNLISYTNTESSKLIFLTSVECGRKLALVQVLELGGRRNGEGMA